MKLSLEQINDKYKNFMILNNWKLNDIHYSEVINYIGDLTKNWYYVNGYDGMFINNQWTYSPIDLCFYFPLEEWKNIFTHNIMTIMKNRKNVRVDMTKL